MISAVLWQFLVHMTYFLQTSFQSGPASTMTRESATSIGSLLLKCRDCWRTFQLESSLLRHYKTAHQSLFTYHCTFCGKGFRESAHLRGHHASKHGLEKEFKCSLCYKEFGYRSVFNKHMKSEHGSMYNWYRVQSDEKNFCLYFVSVSCGCTL